MKLKDTGIQKKSSHNFSSYKKNEEQKEEDWALEICKLLTPISL